MGKSCSNHIEAEVSKHLQLIKPGFELPWRVTTIDLTGQKKSSNPRVGNSSASKKPRRGKKRRMIMRAHFEAKEAEAMAARQALADKEIAWKANRTRKNRNKKLRRKEKDKLNGS